MLRRLAAAVLTALALGPAVARGIGVRSGRVDGLPGGAIALLSPDPSPRAESGEEAEQALAEMLPEADDFDVPMRHKLNLEQLSSKVASIASAQTEMTTARRERAEAISMIPFA
ncbi:unnamed protein product [Prorocentrum cordatum]|uniref:Uncharacterized protein n=1 Tax=Prorocentrum cordatum TaxID=2364126 RepID=A0ABN9P8B9_9DINO|nr:unnamed protein product [Polarella glacialis]